MQPGRRSGDGIGWAGGVIWGTRVLGAGDKRATVGLCQQYGTEEEVE
jgi:hypothetical protein